MSISREKVAALARPCLPHLDMLIVNDFEIGALADVETRANGAANAKAIARAIGATLSSGAMAVVVVHFPEGAIAATRDGGHFAAGSVAMPEEVIAGVNGAGDAFAAGMLYGLHEGLSMEAALRLAHACAAASTRAVSTTAGVASVAECLQLAEKWGLRPAPA
jgi:sugar/nucleoside kinase (ribokinase family)